MLSRRQETADGYQQTGEVWGDAETLFGNLAGSHLSGLTTPGAQARARSEKVLSGSWGDGFWFWLINPAIVTATLICPSADPFLALQHFFTSAWERAGRRDVLGPKDTLATQTGVLGTYLAWKGLLYLCIFTQWIPLQPFTLVFKESGVAGWGREEGGAGSMWERLQIQPGKAFSSISLLQDDQTLSR